MGYAPSGLQRTTMRPPRQVALLIETATITGRDTLQGIGRYIQTHAGWECYISPGLSDRFPAGLGDWKGDGILATIHTDQLRAELLDRHLPVVDLDGLQSESPFPRVLADDKAIGAMAAEEFLQRGHRHFGYMGLPDEHYSELRREGFHTRLAEEGFEALDNTRHSLGGREDWRWWRNQTEQWIRSLPKPVAVLTCNDNQGRTLTSVCNRAELRIPEDVSILGVDNDAVLCQLCSPPLSSIEKDDQARGFQAAALLDALMQGERPPAETITIPPRQIVTRQSSDLLAVEDADVAEALRFIRQNASHPIGVSDVLRHIPISRSSLEKRFAAAIGRLPGEEIRRVHIERAKQLLARSDLPMAEVARRSGLRTAKSLSDVFSRNVGMAPSAYRRQHLVR